MSKSSGIYLVVVFTLMVFCPVGSSAKEASDYVVTVGNETLTYVARPELGYVVKAADRTGDIGVLAAALFIEDGDVRPIRGLDRHGIWVVENEYPAADNQKTIGMLAAHSQVQYAAPLFSSNGETVAIIPEIVIRVEPGIEMEEVQALCQTARCTIKKRMEFTDVEYLLAVLGPDADAVFSAVEQLNEISFVEWACPNTASRMRLAGQVIPNDEYFSEQWYLYNIGQTGGTPGADIHAPEAWEITMGDPNIIIAIVDSGVDRNHPDLINNLVPGFDFYDDDELADPAHDVHVDAHGTMCAGLVAAEGNNLIGVTGVAWNCKIMPIRTMDPDAQGISNETQSDVAAAFRWTAVNGADILSNSWSWGKSPVPIIHSAIVDITESEGMGRDGKGCVVLFAAGNSGEQVKYPAKYPEVIAVGATNHNDARWGYSCYGPELDLTSPSGPDIPNQETLSQVLWTTDIKGPDGWNSLTAPPGAPPYPYPNIYDYAVFGGTSAATPIAAGVAALILSVEPNLTQEEVRHFLERSAKDLGAPGWDEYYGWGRVDARAALDMVLAKRADLNDDWRVDWQDFALLARSWKTTESVGDIGPAPRPDGIVDVHDVILMGQYWLEEIAR